MFQKPIASETLQNAFSFPAQVQFADIHRWMPNDIDDKRFIRLFKEVNGCLVESTMQEIEIGKPVILQLDNGEIVRTSNVIEWTCYGHVGIRTQNREYYYI